MKTNNIIIFEKEYNWESAYDLSRDVLESIPSGEFDGDLKVIIKWERKLPKFVWMQDDKYKTALRLTEEGYYRDGGDWNVGYKWINNKLYSLCGYMPEISNIPLIECTEEEWREDNGQYAPSLKESEDNEEDILCF